MDQNPTDEAVEMIELTPKRRSVNAAQQASSTVEAKEFTCNHDPWFPAHMEEVRKAIHSADYIFLGFLTPETSVCEWNEFLRALQCLCKNAAVDVEEQLPSVVFQSISLAYDLALWVWVSLSEPIPLDATDMFQSSSLVDCPSCANAKKLFVTAFESSAEFVKFLALETSSKTMGMERPDSTRPRFAYQLRKVMNSLGPIVSATPSLFRTNCFHWVSVSLGRKWDAALAKMDDVIKSIGTTLTTASNEDREFVVRKWSEAFELAVLLRNIRDQVSSVESNDVVETFRACLRLKRGFDVIEDLFELVEFIHPGIFVDFCKQSQTLQERVLVKLEKQFNCLLASFPASSSGIGAYVSPPELFAPNPVIGVPCHLSASQISREWVEKATAFRMSYTQCRTSSPQATEELLQCLQTLIDVRSYLFGNRAVPTPYMLSWTKPFKWVRDFAEKPGRIMFLNVDMVREVKKTVRSSSVGGGQSSPALRSAVSFVERDLKAMMLDVTLLLLAQVWLHPGLSIDSVKSTFNLFSRHGPALGYDFLDDLFGGLSHLCGVQYRAKIGYALAKRNLMQSPGILPSEDIVLNTEGLPNVKSDFLASNFKVAPPSQQIKGFLDNWLRRALEMGEFARNCARFNAVNDSKASLPFLEQQFLAFSMVKLTEFCEDCTRTADAVPEGKPAAWLTKPLTLKLFQIFEFESDPRVIRFCFGNVYSLVRLLYPLSRELLALAAKHIREPELQAKLEAGSKRLRVKFPDITGATHELLSPASTVECNPFWTNVIAEFADFVADRSLLGFKFHVMSESTDIQPAYINQQSGHIGHWLQETSKMRSEMSVIETNVAERKPAGAGLAALDQSDCGKILEFARLALVALLVLKSGKVASTESNGLPRFAATIPAGNSSEMCIYDGKHVFERATYVLSRFRARALTPKNVGRLATLIAGSNDPILGDILDAEFRENLATLSKSWDSLVKFGDPRSPSGSVMRYVGLKAVTDDEAASIIVAPVLRTGPSPLSDCPPAWLRKLTGTHPLGSPMELGPAHDPSEPVPPSCSPSLVHPAAAYPMVTPVVYPAPTVVKARNGTSEWKRKPQWEDGREIKIPPPSLVVPSRSGIPAPIYGKEEEADAGPPKKVPRPNEDLAKYELYFKQSDFKQSVDAQTKDLATKVEAGRKVMGQLATLIDKGPSETAEDALKRWSERAVRAKRIDSAITQHTERVVALGHEASALYERERRLEIESGNLHRKLNVYRNLALQNYDSLSSHSGDDLSVVVLELREQIERLRAVVMRSRNVKVGPSPAIHLEATLLSAVQRLAGTVKASRLSNPDICKLFQSEVVPRFQLVQKCHSDMERKVRAAAALLQARDRRLAELR